MSELDARRQILNAGRQLEDAEKTLAALRSEAEALTAKLGDAESQSKLLEKKFLEALEHYHKEFASRA